MSFVLATVLLLAAIGDARVMRFGAPRGGPRLARHLWRMCIALFVASIAYLGRTGYRRRASATVTVTETA